MSHPRQVRDAAARYLHADGVAAVGYFPSSSTAAFDDDMLRRGVPDARSRAVAAGSCRVA